MKYYVSLLHFPVVKMFIIKKSNKTLLVQGYKGEPVQESKVQKFLNITSCTNGFDIVKQQCGTNPLLLWVRLIHHQMIKLGKLKTQ